MIQAGKKPAACSFQEFLFILITGKWSPTHGLEPLDELPCFETNSHGDCSRRLLRKEPQCLVESSESFNERCVNLRITGVGMNTRKMMRQSPCPAGFIHNQLSSLVRNDFWNLNREVLLPQELVEALKMVA